MRNLGDRGDKLCQGVRAGLLGLALTLLQIGLTLSLAPKLAKGSAVFLELNNWDSYHYLDIAENGYHMPPGPPTGEDVHAYRANVAYFPAYPLAARWMGKTLGIPMPLSLLLAAQLFAWAFWTGFFLLLSEWQVSRRTAFWATLAILVHPASFFLVTGYSESLFLASLFGIIFWSERWEKTRDRLAGPEWGLTAAHGFALSATRIVGIPVAVFPLFQGKPSWKRGAVALLSMAGGLLFFVWCQLHYGQWNLYLKLQELGWGNHPDYFAILKVTAYVPKLFFEDTVTSVSRAANPFTVLVFALALGVDLRHGNWRRRAGLYFAAFCLFYISLSGKANANMDSMIRYTHPVFALLVLALAQMNSEEGEAGATLRCWAWRWRYAVEAGFVVALAFQGWLAYRFLHGHWAA